MTLCLRHAEKNITYAQMTHRRIVNRWTVYRELTQPGIFDSDKTTFYKLEAYTNSHCEKHFSQRQQRVCSAKTSAKGFYEIPMPEYCTL